MNRKYIRISCFLTAAILFSGCKSNGLSAVSDSFHVPLKEYADMDTVTETISKAVFVPDADAVETARASALSGMSDEEAQRLKDNIRIANQTLESAYLYGSLFDNLTDRNDLNWNYIDQKGDIQIGWGHDYSADQMSAICEEENLSETQFCEKYGVPVMDYNHFDADNFMVLLEDMKTSVHNPELTDCLELLISYTRDAKHTHDVTFIEKIFHLLHDMDYFLLRYGLEDDAPFVQDASLIRKYFGTLPFYN